MKQVRIVAKSLTPRTDPVSFSLKQSLGYTSLFLLSILAVACSSCDDASKGAMKDDDYVRLAQGELQRLDVPFHDRVPIVDRTTDEVVVRFPPPVGVRAGSFTFRFATKSSEIVGRIVER